MTRSKILEQIEIVADATSAFAKGTAASIVISATGAGTLQTCDTSSGTFEDYATLVDGVNNIDISGAQAYLLVDDSSAAIAVLGDFAVDTVVSEE